VPSSGEVAETITMKLGNVCINNNLLPHTTSMLLSPGEGLETTEEFGFGVLPHRLASGGWGDLLERDTARWGLDSTETHNSTPTGEGGTPAGET